MKVRCNVYWATLWQLVVALVLLWLTRFAFYFYNADVIGGIPWARLLVLSFKGLAFDISVLAYANALFILMRFLPFEFTLSRWWRRLTMAVYTVANSAILIINIGDIPYYRFNGGRLRMDSFSSLMNWETIKVAFSFIGQYFGAFAGIGCVVALLVWLATRFEPKGVAHKPGVRWLLLVVAMVMTFFGMRFCITDRPLGLHSAADMADKPSEINVILNSPFAILRSSSRSNPMKNIVFYSESELAGLRSSLQDPSLSLAADSIKEAVRGKNIVLLILEGGALLWYDSLTILKDEPPKNLMPFLDSLASKSIAVTGNICTSDRSQLGVAAILGGIPTISVMDWVATPYASLKIDATPRLLAEKGYDTKFFIGTKPVLVHLGALALQMGFKEVEGIDDVRLDKKGNTNYWGIYDDVMGRYVAESLSELKEPFFASWMTLDLHGPYDLPDNWDKTGYRETDSEVEQGVQYTDYSLRQFFETASRQPWYDNTMFIITADHGCRDHASGKLSTPFIYSHIPFIIYTPDGSLAPMKLEEPVMAQFDIPATMLWLAGYDKPYVSVGTNYFDTSKPHYGICMRNEMLQVMSSRYVIQTTLDGERLVNVFDITIDQEMRDSLSNYDVDEVDAMLRWLRAFLQDYTARANSARLAL